MSSYFSVQWHITDDCDQRCKHCYIFSEGHPCITTMAWEEMLRAYAQIQALCRSLGRIPYIYLTGGDPVLHPAFWDLLALFKADGTRFCVMGNPFHLTESVCARMKDCGCVKYQLSLDGLEKTHNSFRKPGSFRATVEAIRTIKRSGMWCAVMSTVSKTNMNEIPVLIGLADALGVTSMLSGGTALLRRRKHMIRICTFRLLNTGNFWNAAGKHTGGTGTARRLFNSRIIYGRSFFMKKGC